MHDGPSRSQAIHGAVVGVLLLSLATPIAFAGAAQTQPEADNTITRIRMYENGSAAWSVRIRTRLHSEEAVARYRAFQARFRNATGTFLSAFRDRIRDTVSDARNATGREMNATRFAVSTDLQQFPRRWGVVTYEFVWTGFARRANDTLVVGDVFQGGLFLTANDTLVIEPPPGYAVVDTDPPPDRREGDDLRWRGERNFDDERPAVRFVRVPPTTTTAPTPSAATRSAPPATSITPTAPTNGSRETEIDDPGSGLFERSLPIAAIVLGLGAALALYLFARQERFGSNDDGEDRESDDDGTPPPTDAGGTDAAGGDPADPPVTDAERVERLLESNGGRMRQAAIAEELGWSVSKTSRVLSAMTDEDRVEKLRLGRENVIDLPDEEDS